MIKSDLEHRDALKRLEQHTAAMEQKGQHYEQLNLTPEQIQAILEPEQCFYKQLQNEVEKYEKIKLGQLEPVHSINDLGNMLIALRIASNITQADLARALDVSPSQVSKDENNDYAGITLNRVQKVLEAIQQASKRSTDILITIALSEPNPAAPSS